MSSEASKPLPELYFEWLCSCIDEKGVEIPHGIIVADDGSLTVVALAVPARQAYLVMLDQWEKHQGKEMIFALDRFTKEGQGTTLGDVMAGHYFTRNQSRPFVVEYQHTPRIVKPIDWDNQFWNDALRRELLSFLRPILATASARD